MKAIWICSDWNLLNTLQLFQSEEGLAFSLALFRIDSEQWPLDPQSLYKLVQVWAKLLLLQQQKKENEQGVERAQALVAGPPMSCQNIAELEQRSQSPHMTNIPGLKVKGDCEQAEGDSPAS